MASSSSKKTCSGSSTRKNYWTPLQASCDEDDISDCTDFPEIQKKIKIAPIKILERDVDMLQKLFIAAGIKGFLTKRISIGTKVICESMETFNKIKEVLISKKCQFYTHDQKTERMFKVVLYGLENKTAEEVQKELNTLGHKCQEVKRVIKNYDNYSDTLYIIYFENGSIRLQDLRTKCKSLFYTIVRWEYQRKIKNMPVQCRNCQMFGHGERGCNIKTLCANCAGRHKTVNCPSPDIFCCANCKGKHKSSDNVCPNRAAYVEITHKLSKNGRSQDTTNPGRQFSYVSSQHPPLPKSGNQQNQFKRTQWVTKSYNNDSSFQPNNNNNDLFTEEELSRLTSELISKLQNCNSKSEQFNVITQLAVKYLYSNCK